MSSALPHNCKAPLPSTPSALAATGTPLQAVQLCNPSLRSLQPIEPQPCTHLDHSVDEASTSGKPSSKQRSFSVSPSALEGPLKSSSFPGLRSKIFGSGNSARSAVAASFASPACAIALSWGVFKSRLSAERARSRARSVRVCTVPMTPTKTRS